MPLVSVKRKRSKKKKRTTTEMTLKENYKDIGKGWYQLLDILEAIDTATMLSPIVNIVRHNGMLQVTFAHTDNIANKFIQDSVAYKIERLSAKLCESCGKYGFRRTELPETQTLCTACFAIKYSDVSESVPLWVANQKPSH